MPFGFCSGFDILESKVVGLWSWYEYPLYTRHIQAVSRPSSVCERGIFQRCAMMRLNICGPLRCIDSE